VAHAVIITIAAAAAVLPLPPATVERWFSLGIYPPIQHVVTAASNVLPFALLDLLILATLVVFAWSATAVILETRRERRLSPLGRGVLRTLSAAAVVYLLFLALWGLNYRRVAMSNRLVLARAAPTSEDVVKLGLEAVGRVNALYGEAHTRGWGDAEWRDDQLRRAFVDVQRELSDAPPALPGRLKSTLIGPYFRWTSVDGMVNPFGLEVLANPDLLPFERPFVAAHEWSHLAGYADEAEANFVGWLTCLRASPRGQYSGWLYLYWQISGEVTARDRARMWDALESGPRRDVEAIAERLRRGQLPLLRTVSWLVYDQYLKANRIDEGVRSYGAVITLILRVRFEPEWVPVRRVR
jgi:hypothetical protein